MVQVVETLFELQEGINETTISPELQPAEYRLSYGFYLNTELHEEFPKFYSRECKLNVRAHAK